MKKYYTFFIDDKHLLEARLPILKILYFLFDEVLPPGGVS